MNEDFLTLEQYPAARLKVESIFQVERCLPDQMFKRPYRFQLLSEFDYGMGGFLKTLRKTHFPLAADTSF
jgi:hypothetical protein